MNGDQALELYARAWQTHDQSIVGSIFSENAEYLIQGGKTYNGLANIKEYWKRNEARQHSLAVSPIVKTFEMRNEVRAVFFSTFEDIEEKEWQTVYGELRIVLAENKITHLSEHYKVLRKTSKRNWKQRCVENLGVLLRKSWRFVIQIPDTMIRIFWESIFVGTSRWFAILTSFALGFSAITWTKMPDFLVCFLSWHWGACAIDTPDLRAEYSVTATRWLYWIIACFLFSLPSLYRMHSTYINPLKSNRLKVEGEDLDLMRSHYANAKAATIISGSFGFIGEHPELLDELIRINERGTLYLISSKTEAVVKMGFGSESKAIKLFQSLKSGTKIKFEQKLPLKCSLVEQWDGTEILYKHNAGTNGPGHQEMCIMRGRQKIAPVVELIKTLVAGVAR